MNCRKDIVVAVLAAAFAAGTSGCQMLHEMQPHRLWKWNHGTEGMPPEDYSQFPAYSGDSSVCLASVSDDPPTDARSRENR
jgi:hypothetical protein